MDIALTEKYALRRDPFTEVVGLSNRGGFLSYPIGGASDGRSWTADGRFDRHDIGPHLDDLVPLQTRPAAEDDGIEWDEWVIGQPLCSAQPTQMATDEHDNIIAYRVGKPRAKRWHMADGMIERAAADGLEAALEAICKKVHNSVHKTICEALAAYRSRL